MIIGTGAAAVSAAAVAGGLWFAGDDPDQPRGADAHTAAPECGVVPEEAIARALPEAVLESSGNGPLPGGESTVCVWTSAGQTDEAQGVLRVNLSARFTDASAEPVVTGEESASRAQAAVVPPRGEQVVLGSGTEGQVWRGQVSGTAELAFRTDNLLVRVSYSGVGGGDPVPFEEARETTVAFADLLGEAL
ncbi:hypothetical protein ACWFMI_19105 [Nocardiopsis terrae]